MLNHILAQRSLKVAALGLLTLASACGTSSASPTDAASDTTTNTVVTTPTATPTPTPTPTPTTTVAPSPNGLAGEIAIADNFDTNSGLALTWTNPRGGIAPPSTDPVGAFRMFCTAGQLLKDDPLVYPGQPGASHLHQFFGNTGANASSNYNSLRTTGGTTCGQASTPLNRSGYWMPAMLDGAGSVVKPDFLNVYYKRDPVSDPLCNDVAVTFGVGQCVDLPNGLRFVFGYNMKTMAGGPNDPNSIDSQAMYFECWDALDGSASRGPATGRYHTIAQVAAAGCPVGARLMIIAAAPNCWDGKNLDTADHRSHLANSTGPMYATQMFRACVPDHPYVLPNLEVQISYTVDQNFMAGKWHLSSDEMMPGVAPGTTWHMDYWEAWSPAVKARWHGNCIDKKLTCSEGDVGDGYAIIGAGVPNGWWPTHQLVPVPQ